MKKKKKNKDSEEEANFFVGLKQTFSWVFKANNGGTVRVFSLVRRTKMYSSLKKCTKTVGRRRSR